MYRPMMRTACRSSASTPRSWRSFQHALRARPQVLVTLEDPIEYLIRPMHASALVRQREVGTHVRDFATGLRDALREDPDLQSGPSCSPAGLP